MFSSSDSKKVKPVVESKGQPNKIGNKTKIKGDIVSEGDFRIEGHIEGNVKTSGKVVIGINGSIEGNMTCQNADIEGKFSGELQVRELLSLKSTASVDGNVNAGKLAVEPGAKFTATCSMGGGGKTIPVNSKAKERTA